MSRLGLAGAAAAVVAVAGAAFVAGNGPQLRLFANPVISAAAAELVVDLIRVSARLLLPCVSSFQP